MPFWLAELSQVLLDRSELSRPAVLSSPPSWHLARLTAGAAYRSRSAGGIAGGIVFTTVLLMFFDSCTVLF